MLEEMLYISFCCIVKQLFYFYICSLGRKNLNRVLNLFSAKLFNFKIK